MFSQEHTLTLAMKDSKFELLHRTHLILVITLYKAAMKSVKSNVNDATEPIIEPQKPTDVNCSRLKELATIAVAVDLPQ